MEQQNGRDDIFRYVLSHADLRSQTKHEPATSEPPPPIATLAKDAAERRQVTVMFSDLVGSPRYKGRLPARRLTRPIVRPVKVRQGIHAAFIRELLASFGVWMVLSRGFPHE